MSVVNLGSRLSHFALVGFPQLRPRKDNTRAAAVPGVGKGGLPRLFWMAGPQRSGGKAPFPTPGMPRYTVVLEIAKTDTSECE